jgi:hypothetical protein
MPYYTPSDTSFNQSLEPKNPEYRLQMTNKAISQLLSGRQFIYFAEQVNKFYGCSFPILNNHQNGFDRAAAGVL